MGNKNRFINFKIRFLIISFILIYSYFVFSSYYTDEIQVREAKLESSRSHKKLISTPFQLGINKNRLNNLLNILESKETDYLNFKNDLNLIDFNNVRNYLKKKQISNLIIEQFKNEIDQFLTLNEDKINVKDCFINYLVNKSNHYSFKHPRKNVSKKIISEKTELKPVILMAGNHKYYEPLINSIRINKDVFPDLQYIIYDLGLTESMQQEVKTLCNCKLYKFDSDKRYSNYSPHLKDMNTYSWKPIIIQETLNNLKINQTLIYIDTSIKFKSNKIGSIIETSRDTGILTRYLTLYLACYTDERMFKWFGETKDTFENFRTLEANFIIINKNFITSLIMKAWVTCALDESCIAPKGSHIYGGVKNWFKGCQTCGCHRFDQDAFTIVNSYFYGFPSETSSTSYPTISLTSDEMFFFDVKRRTVYNYINDQIKNLFL